MFIPEGMYYFYDNFGELRTVTILSDENGQFYWDCDRMTENALKEVKAAQNGLEVVTLRLSGKIS